MSKEKIETGHCIKAQRNNMERKKVGIVGNGRYGAFLADFFRKRGCLVQVSDIATNPNNERVVKWADVVIVAVTLMKTVGVIKSLAPFFRPDQLLMDITSTKVLPVKAMLKAYAEVVGLHPLCAPPKLGTFKGQTIFVNYARVLGWKSWVDEFLLATEANIEEMSPKQHDLERTVDQLLEHMCTYLKASVMRKLRLDSSKLFKVASPVYKLTAVQMARMFAQSAELYGGIPMSNPFALKTLRLFQKEFNRYVKRVRQSDMGSYRRDFLANQKHIGSENLKTSLTFSEKLIVHMTQFSEKKH